MPGQSQGLALASSCIDGDPEVACGAGYPRERDLACVRVDGRHRLPLAAVSNKDAEAKLRLRPAMTERVSILIES
jgi:hypothetical protein